MTRHIGFLIHFLLIIHVSGIEYHAIAQTGKSILDQKITIEVHDSPLNNILSIIHENTGVRFSYNPDGLPLDRKITLVFQNKTLRMVLEDISRKADISFELIEQQIVLRSEDKDIIPVAVKKKVTVSGYVRNEETGEVLIGASIYLPSVNKGTITNAYGFYSITLEEGNYMISVAYLGYKKKEISLDLSTTKRIDVGLSQSEEMLEEIIVSAHDNISFVETSQMSTLHLDPEDLSEMPTIMGEGDVIKSLQSIPGIKLHGDGSTMFFVRGGDMDQNLILLDEAPIYNPAHLIGLFSSFIPEAVKDINIYKGDIPASYGGRLSSLIDIKTNDGNLKQFSMNGSLGFLSAKLGLEIPVVKEKSSVYITGRRSTIEWVFKALEPDVRDFYFYDLNTKFNWQINENNRFYFTYYNGEDMYRAGPENENSSGINWNNQAITLRWNHIFNEKLFSNTTLYGSSYNYFFFRSFEANNYWNSTISNITFKTDFSWYKNPENTIYFGLRFGGHNLNPGNFYVNGQLTSDYPYVSKKHAREWAIYGENDHQITERFTMRYGFRLSLWENTGEAIEIEYNENNIPVDSSYYPPGEPYFSTGNLEPRISMNYLLRPDLSLKASYSRTSQYLHLINNSISPFNSLDVWLPSGPNIPDQTANQVALGIMKELEEPGVYFSAETYYKFMKNQIDYTDHAQMLLNPFIESELLYGNAWSYGLELLSEKKYGKFQGWLSYTLSRAWIKTPGINDGNKYRAFYDRPHEISAYLMYDLTERVNLSLNWYYATGAAITTPSGFYYYQGHSVPLFVERNNDRFPSYHRMDISCSFRLNRKTRQFRHFLNFSIYNLYNRKNPIFHNYNKIQISEDTYQIPGDLSRPPDLVSTHRYVLGLIPSLSYHFNFR